MPTDHGPHAPDFLCHRRFRWGRMFYEIPAAPDLPAIDVTDLSPTAMRTVLTEAIATHFEIEPKQFSVTVAGSARC